MHITIRKSSDHNERRTIWLPMEEEELGKVCEELGIEMTIDSNCHIEDARDERFLNTLADDNVNIDELNYLMKRFDGFDPREIDKFYAVVFAEEYTSMADLINLSFNLHCYSLVNNFDDFNELGKDLYLTEKMAVASEELEKLDGEIYALDIIKNNKTARVTPYGVLYRNSNEIDQVYNGKHFPPYGWRESMAILELKAKNQSEFIYLPSPDIEIEKALMRLGVSYFQDCKLHLDSHNLPDKVLGMIPHSDNIIERLDILNKVSDIFLEMDGDVEYFEELMDYIKPSNIDEVFLLAETMYEFETFDGIKNSESYGRYMITESGRFEYDHNLEEYIDFKRYGEEKIANETGAFTDKGYILYHGYNQKLANLLFEKLGIMVPEERELKTLKLYMPLTVTTYDIENDYGDRETLNEPMELGNYEIVDYIDEILEAIERDTLPEEKERGLMRYYDEHDSVNGKVAKYEFSVEMVDDELMGVAILTLNDDLTYKELGKIKENVIGQAADGWGEGFEQREISTDMGDVYISFWNSSKGWFIKTAEEMGINQNQIMGGMKFE